MSCAETVRTVVLARGATRVVVDPAAGGRLTGLAVGGRELLGASADPVVPAVMRAGCFPMAPFAGRLEGGVFDFAGRRWTVPVNLGASAAHGVVLDVPWSVQRQDAASVELCVALDERWPFGGVARQEVRATGDGVEIVLTVENDRRAMPAALGLHPWFRRHRQGAAAVVEVPSTDDGAVTLPPRPWDLCLSGLTRPPGARWEDCALVMEAPTTVWTVYEQDPDAFCLEPLTHPVGALAAGTAAVVEPGRPLSLRARFRLVDVPPPSDTPTPPTTGREGVSR